MSWTNKRKLNAAHTIAVIVVMGCFILMAMGRDGIVHTVLLTVIVFYFGRAAELPSEKARTPTPKREVGVED